MGLLTCNRSVLLQFSTLEVNANKKKEKKKRLNIYLSSKGRHEASDVELLVVQPLKKPLSIGNTTPPRFVLSISHRVWDKHELRRVH